MKTKKDNTNKAWLVAVDMGYGHQRAAFALRGIAAEGKTISANNYEGIPHSDRSIWDKSRGFYDFVSRFKKVPIIGEYLFGAMDRVQRIKPFYPKRNLIVPPTLQIKTIEYLMKKRSWGKHLIDKLNENPIPLIATFPVPAFMAEYWGYKGEIYLLVTDSDAARAWAPLKPSGTKIQYLAPSEVVAERLKRYGVPERNIHYTGFPLPEKITNESVLKKNLRRRLAKLDPEEKYSSKYGELIKEYVGSLPRKIEEPPLITFAIGGAGAQQDLALKIVDSLRRLIKNGVVRFCLVAGTHTDVLVKFEEHIKKQGFSKEEVSVLSSLSKENYFEEFNEVLTNTDILWTKPSEMSFYAALGLPLLLTEPIGSQEVFNRRWLLRLGSAVDQLNIKYADQWLVDLINQGVFAEAAMQGFIEMERQAVDNIKAVVFSKKTS